MPFIMVDLDIITEGIFKFKNKWEAGMMFVKGDKKMVEIAKFDQWKNSNQDVELTNPDGFKIIITKKDWKEMRQAVMKRDKRILI